MVSDFRELQFAEFIIFDLKMLISLYIRRIFLQLLTKKSKLKTLSFEKLFVEVHRTKLGRMWLVLSQFPAASVVTMLICAIMNSGSLCVQCPFLKATLTLALYHLKSFSSEVSEVFLEFSLTEVKIIFIKIIILLSVLCLVREAKHFLS